MKTGRLSEVAVLFVRLGFTAFGGPAAHVALMEDEFVTRRQWIDRKHFLDLVAAVNFIPGPNSTELAIHLGLIRAGRLGLIVAGACFITPAMLIILPLAWLYVRYGQLPRVQPMMGAIGAAMIAIVAAAVLRFARTSIRDPFTSIVAAGALITSWLLRHEQRFPPELLILAAAALFGAIWYSRRSRANLLLSIPLPLISSMLLFFLRVGATLFGSGYVLISYLRSGLVERHHWVTEQQLIDAIAVGQITPGPLLTTATFAGYFLGDRTFGGGVGGGIVCGILATIAIFLPSFLFILLLAPVLDRVRQNPSTRGALDAMNAAVVSLIAVVGAQLAINVFFDPSTGHFQIVHLIIAIASLALLLTTKVNATWVILAAGLIGLIR